MRKTIIYSAVIITILFCMVGFYQVYQKAGLPVIIEHNSLIVENLKDIKSELKTNDLLLNIDGINISTQEELEFILDSKEVGKAISITFLRNDKTLICPIVLIRYYSTRYLVIQILVAIVFVFLGNFVFIKRKNDLVSQLFNWILLFAALIVATTWGRFTIEPTWLGILIRLVFNCAYAFAAILFFHFTLLFPSKKTIIPSVVIIVLYALGLILTVLMSYTFILAAINIDLIWFKYYNNIFNYTRIFFALCVAISLINIVHSYISTNEESQRRKMRWILLGLFVGPLFLVTLWIIPQIITSRGLIDEEYILLSMLSVPITFTVSIVKYHILNIDEIFKRGTVYLFAFFTVLLIYLLVVGLASLLIGVLTVKISLIVSTIAAIIIAALFNTIKEKVQLFVDRKLFKVSYNYREAEAQFIEKLKLCYDEISLKKITIETVQHIIPNDETALHFVQTENHSCTPDEIEYFSSNEKPYAVSEQVEYGAQFTKAEKDFFKNVNYILGLRIYSELNGLVGVLFLSEKKSGFRYNIEDVDLLKVICYQNALAFDRIKLQNNLIIEQMEKTRLKELNELKSYFVSTVSHELKTPLTSIKMFTELIEEAQNLKTEKRNEYLHIIKGESSRLSRLIDNVLDISKIEKGIKEYRKSLIELNDCVKDSIRIMEYQLNLNNFKLDIELTDENTTIEADYDAIVEIIINLISNSIKYSDKQKLIFVKTFQQNSSLILSVEDRGIGISKQDLSKIFNPFERANSTTGANVAGAGLGLAIVKHISDAHKAKLEVKSQTGIGSTFSIGFLKYIGE